MDIRIKALLWASAILVAAWVSRANDLSDGAAFGILAGLSGAAVGSLYGLRSNRGSRRGVCK